MSFHKQIQLCMFALMVFHQILTFILVYKYFTTTVLNCKYWWSIRRETLVFKFTENPFLICNLPLKIPYNGMKLGLGLTRLFDFFSI